MTVNDVMNYNRVIKNIIDNVSNIPALIKFKLLGMCMQFESTVSNFDTVREEKIRQYSNGETNGVIGIVAPNKENYENDDEYQKAVEEYDNNIKQFSADMSKVLESETEINIKKFKAEDIMNAGIPSEYLIHIYDLIEE